MRHFFYKNNIFLKGLFLKKQLRVTQTRADLSIKIAFYRIMNKYFMTVFDRRDFFDRLLIIPMLLNRMLKKIKICFYFFKICFKYMITVNSASKDIR